MERHLSERLRSSAGRGNGEEVPSSPCRKKGRGREVQDWRGCDNGRATLFFIPKAPHHGRLWFLRGTFENVGTFVGIWHGCVFI